MYNKQTIRDDFMNNLIKMLICWVTKGHTYYKSNYELVWKNDIQGPKLITIWRCIHCSHEKIEKV